MCLFTNTKKAEAYSKNDLVEQVKSRTSDTVNQVFYTDYDYDGRQEAFIITEKSEYDQTLWFSSDQEVKKIVASIIWVDKAAQGICQVSPKQKIFVAEGSGADTARVECRAGEKEIMVIFTDNGCPYDPTGKPDPDTKASAEERDAGGMGIFIVKNFLDSVGYAYRDERNILRLKKQFEITEE